MTTRPDIEFSTGVNLRGLNNGLAQARARLRAFGSGTISITLRLRYTGMSVAQLNAITAAINAMRSATNAPMNLAFRGLNDLTLAGVGIASLTAGVYELAEAYDKSRIASESFDRQIVRNNLSGDEAGQAVINLQQRLKISATEAKTNLATMLKAGADLEQAQLFALAGAASSIQTGRTAAQGVEAIAQSLQSGLSASLNTIGIAENISQFNRKVAESVGKTANELTKAEMAQAMEQLLTVAVVNTGELEMLDTALSGVIGQMSAFKSSVKQAKENLGASFAAPVIAGLKFLTDALLTVQKINPETVKAVATTALAVAGLTVVLNLQSVALAATARWTAASTAATTLFAAAQVRAAAAMTAVLAINPWYLLATAITAAGTALSGFYSKGVNDRANALDAEIKAFNKFADDAEAGTAGTKFDQRARNLGGDIRFATEQVAAARKQLDKINDDGSARAIRNLQAQQREVDKWQGRLEGAQKKLADLQNIASDDLAMGDWKKQLQDVNKEMKLSNLTGLDKDLAEVTNKFNELAILAKTTFKDQGNEDRAVKQVRALEQVARARVMAESLQKAATELADREAAAERSRVDSMDDGLTKRRASRELEISDTRRQYARLAEEYKLFPEKVVQFNQQMNADIARIRAQGAKADQDYIRELVGGFEQEAAAAAAKLAGGVSEIMFSTSAELAQITKREQSALASVAGDRGATNRIRAAADSLRRDTASQGKKDAEEARQAEEKKSREQIKATRDRLAEVRATELSSLLAVAEGRSELLDAQYAAEQSGALGNASRLLEIESRYNRQALQNRLNALAIQYQADQEARRQALADALSGEGVTGSDRARLTAAMGRDLQALSAQYQASVTGVTQDASNRLREAQQAALAQQNEIAAARVSLAQASAQAGITDASTLSGSMQARARLLGSLREELALKTSLAAQADSELDRLQAQQAVIQARSAVLAAEREARESVAQTLSDEAETIRTNAEFALGMTRSAAERSRLEADISVSMAAQAQRLRELAGQAGITEDERRALNQQALGLDQERLKRIRELNDERLTELSTIQAQARASLELGVQEATSAAERQNARARLVQSLQQENVFLTQQAALYRAQGRNASEIGEIEGERATIAGKVRALVAEQLADQRALRETGERLTAQAAQLRDAWAEALDRTEQQQQAETLARVERALERVTTTSADYRRAMQSAGNAARLAEGDAESVAAAMNQQQQAIQDAQQALAGLEAAWKSQREAVDSLNSSLGTFAAASRDQDTLNTLSQRAQAAYAASLEAAQEARRRFGAGSPEFAAAAAASASAFQTASSAIQAAADNEVKTLDTRNAKIRRQQEAQKRAMGDIPDGLQRAFDQQTAGAEAATERIRTNAEATVAALARQSGGLGLLDALDAADATADRLAGNLQSARRNLTSTLGAAPTVAFTIAPDVESKLADAGTVFGARAASAILSAVDQQRLQLMSGTSTASISNTVNVIVDGVKLAPDPATRAAASNLASCVQRQAINNAAKRG